MRAYIHSGQELLNCSTDRPDTLAQDPTPPFRGFSLATHRELALGARSRRICICEKSIRVPPVESIRDMASGNRRGGLTPAAEIPMDAPPLEPPRLSVAE